MKRTLASRFSHSAWRAPPRPPAQDAYVIGVTGAMTGPAAANYAPVIEAMKAYLDNAQRQGRHQRPPDPAARSRTTRASRPRPPPTPRSWSRRTTCVMLINSSLSSTYAPADRRVQTRPACRCYFAGAVCPKETYPPADPLQFCSTAFGASSTRRPRSPSSRTQANEPVRIGFAGMADSHRARRDRIRREAGQAAGHDRGRHGDHRRRRRPTTRRSPPSSRTPTRTGCTRGRPGCRRSRTFEALRRLGWTGRYITWAHLNAEEELARHQGPHPLRGRHQRALPGQPADPRRDPRDHAAGQSQVSRPPIWPRASSPGWSPNPC